MTRKRGVTLSQALISVAREKFAEDFDKAPLRVGAVGNVAWATCPSPVVGINGYALIPAEGHLWSAGWPDDDGFDLDDLITVHGGVTYSQHPWIGFDTAHAWDWWPPEYDRLAMSSRFLVVPDAKRWTPELVVLEAQMLARQIAKIGNCATSAQGTSRFAHLDVQKLNTREGGFE